MAKERVVALVRVSTDEQSVDAQRQGVGRWTQAHGMDVRRWYTEDGVSGAASLRPVLEELLRDARAGRFDVLVVPALDRLGRRAVSTIVTMDALRSAGVRVVSLREGLDFGTAAGQLVASVLAHVAEMERAAIVERTKAGMEAARAKGKHIGRPGLAWTASDLEKLRELRDAGHSLPTIRKKRMLRVFTTTKGGRAVVPSERAMRRALASATQ